MRARLLCIAMVVSSCGDATVVANTHPTASATGSSATAATAARPYPSTRLSPTTDVLHGVRVDDPYRWLEDVSSTEVQAWMTAQDAFARERLHRLPLVEELRTRFAELYYVPFKTAPWRRGNRYFWAERDARQEKNVIYWREGRGGERRVLLDPNTWSSDGTVSLGSYFVSRTGKIAAYQRKANAADEATLEFIDIGTGKKLDSDRIEGAKYTWGLAWARNEDGVYYTWVPPPGSVPTEDRPGHAEIRFHKLGTDPLMDPTIHEKTGDPTTFVYADSHLDDRYVFYVVRHGWVSRDVQFLDMHDKPASGEQPRWRPLIVGAKSNYHPFYHGGSFYVRTDEGAPRFRLFKVDPRKTDRASWTEIVPEDPRRPLEYARVVGGRLVLGYLEDVKSAIEIRTLDGKLERTVELPGVGNSSLFGHPEDDDAYLTYTTFTQPTQIFSTSIAKGGRDLYTEVKVPFDATPYVVEQVFATSKDGTRVPAFIVRRKDAPRDGSSPLLLYGYGGYGASTTPAYWGSIVPWLERGGVAAFANIRGGGEYGEQWHKDGMRRKKQNVIDDFHAVAEHLIAEGYTRPDRLVIRGESNGGLLVGAALVQRPELYRSVLCGVPLLDMVRYHRYGAGKTWIEEFGTPEDQGDFEVLHALSPYHHVRQDVRYPSVLVLTADTDDRVDPMHARKFAAMLQARSAGGEVLLRIEKNAGHGGADLIQSAVAERADSFAFVMHEVGMDSRPAQVGAHGLDHPVVPSTPTLP